MKPNKWSDFEKFLKAAHLMGRKVTVTIRQVEVEEVHSRPGKVESVPVCYFENRQKGLILSASNQRTLQKLFGDSIADCVGKTIALEAVPVQVGRETKRPIRIFAAQPPVAKTEEQKPVATTTANPVAPTQLSDVAIVGNGLYTRSRTVN